jgi:F-type H+-transporting ATPase subunit epsilon
MFEVVNLESTLQCDLVSAESSLFSDLVKFISIRAEEGEIGIVAGHSPLLTSIPPGHVKIIDNQGEVLWFFIEGGYLEIQPHAVTILTDIASRAADLDLQKALESKKHAEKVLAKSKSTQSLDYTKASHDLLEAMAKIQIINAYRKNKRQ